jgi:hypothetical protein
LLHAKAMVSTPVPNGIGLIRLLPVCRLSSKSSLRLRRSVLLSHRNPTGFASYFRKYHNRVSSRFGKCTTESRTFANVLQCNRFGAVARRKSETALVKRERSFNPGAP